MRAFVGTSGWQYADWRSRFSPEGLATGGWLQWYARMFPTVGAWGGTERVQALPYSALEFIGPHSVGAYAATRAVLAGCTGRVTGVTRPGSSPRRQ
jgi:hypothetical protein